MGTRNLSAPNIKDHQMASRGFGPFPEPVPVASQLAVLPFLSAVEGFIRQDAAGTKFRITMHRVMTRDGQTYLQQLCVYLGQDQWNGSVVGRILPVTEGIIGRSFEHKKIVRTRFYNTPEELLVDLQKDMDDNNEGQRKSDTPVSYLAIPFLGYDGQVVAILYADIEHFNFFADDQRIAYIKAMCDGMCRLFDRLQENPFPTLRNYPLQQGEPVREEPTGYRRLQEPVNTLEPPTFLKLDSLNYEASAA